jgi:hypothetical protein
MAPARAPKKPAATKSNRPVTLKHLAAVMAEEHQLTNYRGGFGIDRTGKH